MLFQGAQKLFGMAAGFKTEELSGRTREKLLPANEKFETPKEFETPKSLE